MLMSLGAALVGVGILLILLTYVTQPFRAQRFDVERAVETWTEAVKADLGPATTEEASETERVATSRDTVNYCPYCGRQISEDFRFCPGCGKPLDLDEDV